MNQDNIDKNLIVSLFSENDNTTYHLMKRKQAIFEAELSDGRRKCLCILQSKYHTSINGYWIDITAVQKNVLDSFDDAVVCFCLQGLKFAFIKWSLLKEFLTVESMIYNTHEKDHWKLYIKNFILINRGNGQELLLNFVDLTCN